MWISWTVELQAIARTNINKQLFLMIPSGPGGGGGAITPAPPPLPPLGASRQQLVAKGVTLRRPWTPKAPDAS